jgi:flagellar protein FlgJ
MEVSQLQSLAAAVGGVAKSATVRDAQLDPKLVAAAHQFEASMMAELLKPLSAGQTFGGDDEDAGGAAGGGGLSDLTSSADGSGGALMSFGSEALAKALSEKGGLGIARRVLDHFEAAGETAKRASADPDQAAKSATGKIRYGIGNHY